MTLGEGLSVDSVSAYGVSVVDDATLGCDLDPQLEVLTEGTPGPATPGCENWRALWPFLVAGERPQVVALGLGRWEVTDHLLDGQWVHVGEPVWDDHLDADLQSAIAIFRTFGARVVLFTMPYLDPADRQPDGLPWAENSPARRPGLQRAGAPGGPRRPRGGQCGRPEPDARPRRGLHRDPRRAGRPLRRHPHQRRRRAAVAASDPARKSIGSAWRTRRQQGPTCDGPGRGGGAGGRGRRRVRAGGDGAGTQCRRSQPRCGAHLDAAGATRASSRCGRACCRRGRWPPPACWPTAPASSSPSPWPASGRRTATASSTS